MQNSHFTRRTAVFLTAFFCFVLTGFSIARAEGYQASQNLQPGQSLANYQVSPDGKYAVYQIDSQDANYNQSSQLFSVTLATAQRRAISPVVGGDGKFIGSYKITPNSQYVVYTASLEADAFYRSELYSIPIAATSQTQRKNIGDVPATAEIDIFDFYISPNSSHVVYQSSEENSNYEDFDILFRVAPTGGAVTQLTPRTPDGEASDVIFTPDSSRIIYQYESPAYDGTLYQSVSISGTGRKTLTDRIYGDGEGITSDSQRFVFTADFSENGDGGVRLYSIKLTGSETLKQLSKTGEEVYSFQFANGYPVLVYAFKPAGVEGYSPTAFGFAIADKSYESVSYNTGKEINYYNYAVSPTNTALIYIAGGYDSSQLYSLTYQNNAPLDQQISNAPVNAAPFTGVTDFKIAANGQRVVFRATQGNSYVPDLFSVAIANTPVAVKLNNLSAETGANADYFGVNSYFVTPNSQRVIFTYPPNDGSCCGSNVYTNAVTGGTPTGPFATGANDDPYGNPIVLTADARRLVYTKTAYDQNGTPSTTIWTANVPQ